MVDSNAVMALQLYICLNTKHLYQGVTYFSSKGYVTFDTTFKEFLGLWTCFLELYLNAEGRRGRTGGGGGGGDVSQWPPPAAAHYYISHSIGFYTQHSN